MSDVADIVHLMSEVRRGQTSLADQLKELTSKVDTIMTGFPAGDIEGHRRYHETMIELVAERRRLRLVIQEKTLTALVWALLVFLAVACGNYMRELLTKAPTHVG